MENKELMEQDVNWETDYNVEEKDDNYRGEESITTYDNIVLQNLYDVPNGAIISTVPAGKVEVLSEGDGWAEVEGGWIKTEFLQ